LRQDCQDAKIAKKKFFSSSLGALGVLADLARF
jgi:hypothetical protein